MSEQFAVQDEARVAVLSARVDALLARIDEQAVIIRGLQTRVGRLEATLATSAPASEQVSLAIGDPPITPVQQNDGDGDATSQPDSRRRLQPLKSILAIAAIVFLGVGLSSAMFELPARLPRSDLGLVLLVGGFFAAAFLLIASLDAERRASVREG